MHRKITNEYFKPDRWGNLTGDKKSMDNPYVQSYNNSIKDTSYDPDDAWKKSNEKALRYVMCSMGFGPEDYHPWNDDENGEDRFWQDYGERMAKEGR